MARSSSPVLSGLTSLSPEERERLIRESRGPMALGVMFSFYGLSVIAVATRIYVRMKISKQAKMDDWIILVSEILCTATVIFVYYQIHNGDGRHLLAITTLDVDNIAKMNFGALIGWTLSVTAAKVSIFLQYLRWFPSSPTTKFMWALMVIVLLGCVSTLVAVLTACIPIRAFWTTALRREGKCLDQRLYWQVQPAFEAVTCWIMLGLLIPPLWRLQMPKGKKIGVIILLGLSSSSCIASLLRMKVLFDTFPKDAVIGADFTWTGIMATLYAIIELLLGIICCSIPALMPLRYRLLPCFFKRHSGPLAARRPPHLPLPPPQVEQKAPALVRPLLPSVSSVQSERGERAAQPLLPACHSMEISASMGGESSATQVSSNDVSERSSSTASQSTLRSMSTEKTPATLPVITET